jgi:hypothetical protein
MSSAFKIAYAASSNLTVTNLHSIASSATWVAGWESGAIDNTSNLYDDYLISAKIALGNSATAGQIRVYFVRMLDDSTWPDVFDGTESTETITTTTIRDGIAKLALAVDTRADPGTDDVYYLDAGSVAAQFGGICPPKFVVFITHSTGVNLASSGNQVTAVGAYYNIG